jgi:hypothetical protein
MRDPKRGQRSLLAQHKKCVAPFKVELYVRQLLNEPKEKCISNNLLRGVSLFCCSARAIKKGINICFGRSQMGGGWVYIFGFYYVGR